MIDARPMNDPEFRVGDQVVLGDGTYQGTPGVFLSLRADLNWADIKELNGRVRSHPVKWLQHSNPPGTSETGESGTLALPRLKEHTK